jgi:hypothetical protein
MEHPFAGCPPSLVHYSSSYPTYVVHLILFKAIKSTGVRWATHVARRHSWETVWEETTFVLPKGGWEDNIKIDLRETRLWMVDRAELADGKVHRRVVSSMFLLLYYIYLYWVGINKDSCIETRTF